MSWGDPPPGEVVLEPQDSPGHPLAPWFAHHRETREANRRPDADPTARRRRAIITMVHNEPIFLPLWLRYYSRFFDPENIYVLDNQTTDGSSEGDGFVRIPVTHDTVDHQWMVDTIAGLQHELLDRYDVVVATDADEIIAPAPKLGDLGDYLDRFREDWVNCLGYELLHRRDLEPALDLEQPILAQRGWWFSNDAYDKAAVATIPLEWRPGFHGRTDFQFQPDPDLRMIHLHRMDYDICLERHRTRSRKSWAPHDERERWAAHNQIVERDELDRWFYEDAYFRGVKMNVEQIPDEWRDRF